MTPVSIVKSVLRCGLTMWGASTVIFLLYQGILGRDPLLARAYGLRGVGDRALWEQYLLFLGDVARLDFSLSRIGYPARVSDLIAQFLPWTIGLLTVTTLVAFSLGTLLGGLLAWPGAPRSLRHLLPLLFAVSAVPFYLLGLILVYIFAFRLKLFPLSGGSPTGLAPSLTPAYLLALAHHALLPGLAIVLSSLGFWAIAMRGMMVTVLGEDFILLAEAKGLRARRVFLSYALRNALLPQVTALGISLGQTLSGALLVEIIFQYPGLGTLLFRAVTGFDYNTIYGVVLVIIVAVSLAGLILDLLYPLLDPRSV